MQSRIQVIKSVLFSNQIFWAQIFVMPKKVIRCIESICRKFLWFGGVDTSRKALIAWETLCWPKVAGGLNFLNIATWNKAVVCKLLWSLGKKKTKCAFSGCIICIMVRMDQYGRYNLSRHLDGS